jgi:hypothetical protein
MMSLRSRAMNLRVEDGWGRRTIIAALNLQWTWFERGRANRSEPQRHRCDCDFRSPAELSVLSAAGLLFLPAARLLNDKAVKG